MEDFVLRMLEDYNGFTKRRLYRCYKVLVSNGELSSSFLVVDDIGCFREIPITKFGPEEVGKYLRQQAGLPEELRPKEAAPTL